MSIVKSINRASVRQINEAFKGKKITEVLGLEKDSNGVLLKFEDETLSMYHDQDCCEVVYIEDVQGKVDLLGATFQELIERDCYLDSLGINDSYTWTFYTLVTSKGYTDIRWYGSSNGYYSESVDFEIKVKDNL